jgi:iron complex transport system substrate-binding protein
VTHECDFPAAALSLPHVTRDMLPGGLSAAEIDAAVRERTERGEAIYELDAEQLEALEPDLIVTQELCPVCAVSYDDVCKLASTLATQPRVVALDPHTLGESFGDVRTIAQLTDSRDAALDLIARQRARVDVVRLAMRGAERVPVAAVEWFDPVFVAGHWTPQIIELAGGIDVLGFAGEHSERATWSMLAAAAPRVVVCMPCGYDAERSAQEARTHADALRSLGAERVVAVDASAYFSRPGPRLVDGLELMAHILHPDRVPHAPGAVHDIEL